MSHDSRLADAAKSGVTPSTLSAAAIRIKQDYQNFLKEAQMLMPKVDQSLLLDILYYQTRYPDWEGSVGFQVVYPADLDISQKKEWIYQKYQRMSKVEEEKTLKFKAIRMSIEELGKMLDEDPDIQYVTGSATLAPTDSYLWYMIDSSLTIQSKPSLLMAGNTSFFFLWNRLEPLSDFFMVNLASLVLAQVLH
jgi:hypothetical protein